MGDTNFARRFRKHAGRASEMLRQNIGKADKTTDEDFEDYVKNFHKQQGSSLRLNKEVKNYYNCIKALQVASKGLMDVIFDMYEPNWVECDKVQVKATMLEKKWINYVERLNDQVIGPLAAYVDQFQDISNKILKRKRKLLDYDFCRHTIQSLEQGKKQDGKLSKARAELAEKQNCYESINSELLLDLPTLYDSRVSFLASNMQSLFVAEASFHGGAAKIFGELNDTVEALAIENQTGVYSCRKMLTRENVASLQAAYDNKDKIDQPSKSDAAEDNDCDSNSCVNDNKGVQPSMIKKVVSASAIPAKTSDLPGIESDDKVNSSLDKKADKGSSSGKKKVDADNSTTVTEELAIDSTTSVQNPGDKELKIETECSELKSEKPTLYQVEATHPYVAEDGDELSFESGEIINVIEIDDPDQQEEGWLYGYIATKGTPGLFPANFTKPL